MLCGDLQSAFPAVFNGTDRNTDRRTTIRYTVAELINRLGFVLTGKTLVVVCTVDAHMTFDVLTKVLTDLGKYARHPFRALRR